MTDDKEKDRFALLEKITDQYSDLALAKAPDDQLVWKKTAEVFTGQALVKYLILAYCETCDYSEYMVRFFWKGQVGMASSILHIFHYDRHPHKVRIAFVQVPNNSPFLDIPICSNCGREHTYRTGQGKTTPCWKFERKPINPTFKWFNMIMDFLGESSKTPQIQNTEEEKTGMFLGLRKRLGLPSPKNP